MRVCNACRWDGCLGHGSLWTRWEMGSAEGDEGEMYGRRLGEMGYVGVRSLICVGNWVRDRSVWGSWVWDSWAQELQGEKWHEICRGTRPLGEG